MSGHSKWSTIKRKKGAADAKRGQIFTKLGNTIAIAAKSGGDPSMNPALALAIDKAKQVNMPSANIERSIKRGTGELGGGIIEEIVYEGYGPSAVGIIVECATDNRNRTSSEVRAAFSKHGGNMAENGSVSYQFDHRGIIEIKTSDSDASTLSAIDAGAIDVDDSDGEILVVYTDAKELKMVQDALKTAGENVQSASLGYVPQNLVTVDDEKVVQKVMNLMDVLDDLDDVVETYTNFDPVSDE